jgi:hypothetical protein
MPELTRIAVFGGIYSNYLALDAAIEDARQRGAEKCYCLGDFGAFGPNPDRVFPLLREHRIECIQGNYDNSIGNDLADCQCGYTDPRDNHLAARHQADVILATHTGIKWHRVLTGNRHFVNVGVLGRPENDGRMNVWYALLEARPELRVEFVPVEYDHERLAAEMQAEGLPEEFVTTVLTGWWTTCLEILPAKERRRGKY